MDPIEINTMRPQQSEFLGHELETTLSTIRSELQTAGHQLNDSDWNHIVGLLHSNDQDGSFEPSIPMVIVDESSGNRSVAYCQTATKKNHYVW